MSYLLVTYPCSFSISFHSYQIRLYDDASIEPLSEEDIAVLIVANHRASVLADQEDKALDTVISAHVMAYLMGCVENGGEFTIVDDIPPDSFSDRPNQNQAQTKSNPSPDQQDQAQTKSKPSPDQQDQAQTKSNPSSDQIKPKPRPNQTQTQTNKATHRPTQTQAQTKSNPNQQDQAQTKSNPSPDQQDQAQTKSNPSPDQRCTHCCSYLSAFYDNGCNLHNYCLNCEPKYFQNTRFIFQ